MAASVLATKLYIPLPRAKAVSRPRLIERLNEGLRSAPGVILISAPAGFGKTSLLSRARVCLAQRDRAFAWP